MVRSSFVVGMLVVFVDNSLVGVVLAFVLAGGRFLGVGLGFLETLVGFVQMFVLGILASLMPPFLAFLMEGHFLEGRRRF